MHPLDQPKSIQECWQSWLMSLSGSFLSSYKSSKRSEVRDEKYNPRTKVDRPRLSPWENHKELLGIDYLQVISGHIIEKVARNYHGFTAGVLFLSKWLAFVIKWLSVVKRRAWMWLTLTSTRYLTLSCSIRVPKLEFYSLDRWTATCLRVFRCLVNVGW